MKRKDMHLTHDEFESAFGVSGELPGTRPDLQAQRAALEELFAPLLGQFPAAEPDASLFDAIEAEIDGIETAPVRDVRAEAGEWAQVSDKVWKKTLSWDPETKRSTFLLRCLPGAVIQPHLHKREELIFVIEGELWVDGKLFSPGDAQISVPESLHSEISMPAGCLVLVSG